MASEGSIPSVGIAGGSATSMSPPADVPTPQKPIVPKEDYIPKPEEGVTSKLAAKRQEAPSSMNWLTGLAVSVSQLFAGTPTEAAGPNAEESKD